MHGNRAVVLGASMAGLLAARVLADFYDTVVVAERDSLPAGPAFRRGVPQGRHAHLLWGRGSSIIDGLFPGFIDGLVDAGAKYFDGDLSKAYLNNGGHALPPSGQLTGFRFELPSRLLLESHVRQRVRGVENIQIRDGHDVVDLVAAGERVTGAVVRPHDGGSDEVVDADLVVDAMGRGGRTPAFLESMGYERPRDDSLDVRLMYSTLPIRLPQDAMDEVAVIVGPIAGRPIGMALLRNEDDTAMFTVYGMAGVESPTGLSNMVDFVRDVIPAHVTAVLRSAEPLGDTVHHRMPATRWRRYDKMSRWPAGLLAIGDAICSFNPIYGQGMTIAALDAEVLQHCLRAGTGQLQRRYFRAAAKPIGNAWQLATGADLNLPEIPGPRPVPVRVINTYVKHAQAAARSNIAVAERLTRVVGLLEPPARLLTPGIALRVAATNLKNRRIAT